MLTTNEFRQLFNAIVPMSQNRINGRDHVDTLHVLNLLAAFCGEQVRIECDPADSAGNVTIHAYIGRTVEPDVHAT
jgi:hypothetical protein